MGARLTSQELERLLTSLSGYTSEADKRANKEKISKALREAYLEADAAEEFREQLRSQITKNVQLEVTVMEMNAQLEASGRPVVVASHAFVAGKRGDIDVTQIAAGIAIVFTDEPEDEPKPEPTIPDPLPDRPEQAVASRGRGRKIENLDD
jgi:hypothetical protein